MDEPLQKQLVRDYEAVFGLAGARTPAQQRVMADLERQSSMHKTLLRRDNNGAIDPLATIVAEGGRMLVLHIVTQLEKAASPDAPKQG